MKWIYNDYEFDNRVNNLSWTISGMYNEDIDVSEKEYLSKDVALYFAIIAGARRKYVDWNVVKKYSINRIKKGYDKNILLSLIQIVLNRMVEAKVIEDRPGVEDIRRKSYKDIVSGFTTIYKDDILQKIKYAAVLEGIGKHPTMEGLSRRIFNDIKNIDVTNDTMEILQSLDIIYLNYFEYILNENREECNKGNIELKNIEVDFDTFGDFMYEELYSEEDSIIENEIDSMSSSMLVEEVGESNSLDLGKSSNRVIYNDEKKYMKKLNYHIGSRKRQ